MALRHVLLTAVIAASTVVPDRFAAANDWVYGAWSRPACGKVCKLVCEKQTLVSTCYACECEDICIPPPSRPGCKHCAACCDCEPTEAVDPCCPQTCCDKGPKCEFCWRDWFACGCARPRTVKVLTKYQAEKEICWYHWEVVDAAACDDAPPEEETAVCDDATRPIVFKPAPSDAELGDALPLTNEERVQLASFLNSGSSAAESDKNATMTAAGSTADLQSESSADSLWQSIRGWFGAR